MLARLKSSAAAFQRREDGTIAILFGLCVVVVVGIVGLTVDGGRAMGAQAKANSALDAAALAATRALSTSSMTDAEITDYAREFFRSNVSGAGDLGASYQDLEVEIDRDSKTVRLAVDTHVPTTFGRVFGLDSLDFTSATVATFNVQDIELSMALDVTGSMRGQKLADLKVASKNLIDILIPDSGSISNVRIALAPYDASVNAGPLAAAATDGASVDGCVIERSGSEVSTDTEPGPGRYFGAWSRGMSDVDPFEGRSPYSCPSARVMPLTSDKDALKASIDSLRDGGYTAGHLGTAWAWYMLSEKWSGFLPADSVPGEYGKKNLIKAVVLMTDGVFNTAWSNGSATNQTLSLCDEMKDAGVIVYSVSFKSPKHPTLMSCASNDPDTGNPNYYEADNGAELNEAFQDIAIKLTALRLAR